ncbi:DUF1127 domain-containing protein [Tropicimonas marinistellae]|uniref:DUF1127 domain-containing protein n=1 Tax=Tropicimonas marinistellae TaxID=1739787 RepID=UPI000837898B|nr:DUF1127 domain-containing protein [Tropicimonas marinistellae]
MAFVNTETRLNNGLVSSWFSGLIASFSASMERRRAFLQTRSELNAMTDRELSDIGITRFAINDVARDAARMA